MKYEDSTYEKLVGILDSYYNQVEELKEACSRLNKLKEECCHLADNFKLLLDSTDEGIYGLDADGLCTMFNRSAAKMTKYEPEEVIGKDIHRLIHHTRIDGTPCPSDKCPIIKAIKDGEGCRVDNAIFWRKDGTFFPVEYSSYPMMEEGNVKGAVVTFNDITIRKEMENELLDSKKLAELYVDLMGHDINNMNQAAIGFLEIAIEKLRSEIGPDDVALLMKACDMMKESSHIIENVRKLQSIEEGGYRNKRIDIGEILSEIVEQYSSIPDRHIKIKYKPEDEYSVMANELARDMFGNIIGNSVKHSKGLLNIDIRVKRVYEKERGYYEVIIEDDGPGIRDDIKARLFQRHTLPKGGLGLYLVRKLAESYDGSVRVEDRIEGDYKKGSRFIILLPALD
ncbi:histidine kinase [Methanocella sp. CWC-04]|uniref:histidine kinase n=1 Tax=Methanooceanicella nereidis TaxID=2052831 RepID=A0AAP2RD34_9EURY|nr:ATP-binding protein [Methanocella sp. CWC-04]MCD1294047.1 histidine kinase [Methanocella sp. CWC-04]